MERAEGNERTPSTTAAQRHAARLAVAQRATGPDDLARLLDMLDLRQEGDPRYFGTDADRPLSATDPASTDGRPL
ncbi:hypothetical protein [Streptomyces sp. NPDC008121]|uniref:hypothetical protein n=1 Tax=Streptomyces sp. NPDC008121 TaxID=3364809 RepID=UPI0036EFC292